MVCLIIPALNEEASIGAVVRSIPPEIVQRVIVVDNGSTDRTSAEASAAGALVIAEPQRGYGRACAAGVRTAQHLGAQVLAFMDGDGSDCPEFLPAIVQPVLDDDFDFVIGSRTRGKREPGSLNLTQHVAAGLAGLLLRLLYRVSFTDMSPFRAIRADRLAFLGMQELTYGWNLEMQMLAARQRLRILEIPVDHRLRRGGKSKVSGDLMGTLKATYRIFLTFTRVSRQSRKESAAPSARKN